jgi:AAA15 family ATPase/GTPase
MIKEINIENYKSVVNVTLPLGRVNVLIGENGCGKSNILEGIALASASNAGKLDFEYFQNRGIRVTDPKLMRSAFANEEENKLIIIRCFFEKGKLASFNHLTYDNSSRPPRWVNVFDSLTEGLYILNNLLNLKNKKINTQLSEATKNDIENASKLINKDLLEEHVTTWYNVQKDEKYILHLQKITEKVNENYDEIQKKYPGLCRSIKNSILEHPALINYAIFSPEESALRTFSEYKMYPLGIKGEGLFRYLKERSQREDAKDFFKELNENLTILDWFESIDVPPNLISNDYTLQIKDQYLDDTIKYFDQNSTNEGFLYLLFYLTLFISEDTPAFFAIDNLETSFNPKMCREITRRLIELAKQHNKQLIITTHNPSILDGLNIADDDERLFVVRRNIDGHTQANRVEYKNDNEKKIPLSEAWLKGYLGGLPRNF